MNELGRYVDIAGERLVSRGVRNAQILDTLLKVMMFTIIGAVIIALYLPIFRMGSVV